MNKVFLSECKSFSIRTERDRGNGSVGSQFVKNSFRNERDEVDLSIFVDSDQENAVRRQSKRREVVTTLERQCRRFVVL